MRALRRLLLLAIGSALLLACGQRPEVDFQVRDPAAVRVEIATASGQAILLPPGRERREETVPRTTPPYRGRVLFEASAIREPSGAITMRCDACFQVPITEVLPADGHGHFDVPRDREDVPRDIEWTDGEVRIGYGYAYYVPEGHSSRGPYDAFRYELAIPRDDLLSIRERREDHRLGGLVALAIGIPLSVLAVGLIVDGAHHTHQGDGVSNGSSGFLETFAGGALAAPALAVDILGTAFLCGPAGYDRSLDPRSSR